MLKMINLPRQARDKHRDEHSNKRCGFKVLNKLIKLRPVVIQYLLRPILVQKRFKFRLSGSARKSQKRFRDTPKFNFQAVLGRIQLFSPRSVEKRGDQSRFKSLGLYTNVGRSRYGDDDETAPRYEQPPFADDLAPHTQHVWWSSPTRLCSVDEWCEKRRSFAPFDTRTDHFTKTGSGQT
jgi:hypothetical protein